MSDSYFCGCVLLTDSQPPDVTHNTAQSRRPTAAADRVNRYHPSRQSSMSDDSMGKCHCNLFIFNYVTCWIIFNLVLPLWNLYITLQECYYYFNKIEYTINYCINNCNCK
jgi:hypothetical protein